MAYLGASAEPIAIDTAAIGRRTAHRYVLVPDRWPSSVNIACYTMRSRIEARRMMPLA